METLEVRSPFDQHLIKKLALQSEKEGEEALARAFQLHRDYDKRLSKATRIAILKTAHRIASSRAEELAKAAAEEGGKPLIDSRVEVQRAISGLEIAVEHLALMAGTEIPMRISPESAQRMAFSFYEPRGVVLAISAFNHPLNLIVHQAVPAIAVGAPVIVKPALRTPLSCLNLMGIMMEAGLPEGWFQTLLLDNDATLKLVTDKRVSFLSFIGSSRVGWMLRSKLPPGATCALEHGGVAPVIVELDADVEDAIPRLVKGGFYHAGQVCVSVQRIYVHESIVDKFAKRFAAAASKLVVGDPLDAKTEVGPLIASSEVIRVNEWVQEACKAGAELLCGGKKISESCYQPTVLLNPTESVRLSTQEVFGPVVSIYSYKTLDEALERANRPFVCFQASIFTKNIDTAIYAAHRLEATAVMINDHTAFRVDWMPFGGRKDSGLGIGGIPYSMEEMSAKKMMVIRSRGINT